MKNDNEIYFQNRKWIANQTLNEAFSEAFEGIDNKLDSVVNAGFGDCRTWYWKMMFNIENPTEVVRQMEEIQLMLIDFEPMQVEADKFIWLADDREILL